MTTIAKKRISTPFPRAKIAGAVRTILPKGNFELKVANSTVGEMKIVRVITSAWRTLRPAQRIEKVLAAVSGKLSPEEEDGILRFSVLTPAEYNRVVVDHPLALLKRTPRGNGAKRLKAKRATRKAA